MTEWKCGRYIVRQAIRADNPAFPLYLVFRAGKLVGRSFSVPNRDWCEAIERINETGRYVTGTFVLKSYSYRLRGAAAKKHSRASG